MNLVRAGMIGEGEGFDSMAWTSLREYRKPPTRRFEWMETAKGFEVVDLRDTTERRRRYIERLEMWNPHWRGFKKFPYVFGEGVKISGAVRKKAVVACARMLMVDLWRLNTGQTTLENLGLIPAELNIIGNK